jgi:hypothetical protein
MKNGPSGPFFFALVLLLALPLGNIAMRGLR